MFKRILTTALVLGALNVQAAKTDSTVSAQMEENLTQSTMAAKGVRVGLVKTNLDYELSASMTGVASETRDLDGKQKLGLFVGYAQIPVRALGVTAGVVYDSGEQNSIQNKGKKEDANFLRGEGSLTYGVNQNLYLLAGLNISYVLDGLEGMQSDLYTEMKTGFGLQAGIGGQINKNIGVDLVYRYTSHAAKARIISATDPDLIGKEIDLDYKMKGPQLTLTGTF